MHSLSLDLTGMRSLKRWSDFGDNFSIGLHITPIMGDELLTNQKNNMNFPVVVPKRTLTF